MRDPSIHITATIFEEINKKLELGIEPERVKQFFILASQHQLTSRKVNLTNDRIEKKAKMMLSSHKGDAQLFASLLIQVRKQKRHRGINIIKEGGKDWLMIKEIVSLALEFCNDFELTKREGFIEYIKVALDKMAKFSLNKVNSMHQSICDTYVAIEEIQMDDHEELTKECHHVYSTRIIDKTGWETDYTPMPDKYVFFVRAATNCIRHGVSPKIYIDAQFEAFAYKDGIPDPAQITGLKAEERVGKYMFENKIEKESKKQESTIDFAALKELGNG